MKMERSQYFSIFILYFVFLSQSSHFLVKVVILQNRALYFHENANSKFVVRILYFVFSIFYFLVKLVIFNTPQPQHAHVHITHTHITSLINHAQKETIRERIGIRGA